MNWPFAGDDELREIMQEIMTVTPGIGQTRMLGALHSRGIPVQRWKVREMMREQDPVQWNSTSVEKLNLPFGNLQFQLTFHACVLPLALVGRQIYCVLI